MATETKIIEFRTGLKYVTDLSRLLPGECMIFTDFGEFHFCYSAGLTKQLMTKEEVLALLNASPQAYTALQQLISELSNQTVLTGLLADIATHYTEFAEATGYGVITGLTVSAQTTPNMTVKAITGTIHMPDGKRFTPAANSSIAVTVANATNPRIDIVYVSSAGVISYLAGTAAASPVVPTVPSGGVILAQIAVAANATTIASANITDKRQIKYNNNYLFDNKLDKTGDSKDNITSFTVASVDGDITSGETHSTILGKVLRRFNIIKNVLSAPTYSPSSTYLLGAFCVYGTVLYKCTTAITVAEAWNAAHWTTASIIGEIFSINSNLANQSSQITTINSNLAQKTAGKFILPNGLKMQWGRATCTYANTNVLTAALTFGTAFTAAPTITTALEKANTASLLATNVGLSNIATTGCSIAVHLQSGGFDSASVLYVNWFAIGY